MASYEQLPILFLRNLASNEDCEHNFLRESAIECVLCCHRMTVGKVMLFEVNPTLLRDKSQRWFTDSNWDLFVWYSDSLVGRLLPSIRRIRSFQLATGKPEPDCVIVWKTGGSVETFRSLETAAHAGTPKTPILKAAMIPISKDLVDRFRVDAASIDSRIFEFVVNQLEQATTSSI